MFKVNQRIRRSSAQVSQRQWLVVAMFATAIVSSTAAAINGAELVDSGWAVAVPAPLSAEQPTDVHQQIILRNVLEGTQRPLLQNPSPTAEPLPARSPLRATQRFALRPDGVDGWRPAGQSASEQATTSSNTGSSSSPASERETPATVPSNAAQVQVPEVVFAPQDEGPSLGIPATAATQPSQSVPTPEAECDCSGRATTANSGHPSRSTLAMPSLADAYRTLTKAAEADETKDVPKATASTIVQPTPEVPVTVPESVADSRSQEDSGATAANTVPAQDDAPDSSDNPSVAEDDSNNEDATAESSPTASTADNTSSTNNTTSAATVKPAKPVLAEVTPPPPLTRQLMALRSRVRGVLKGYYRKMLTSTDNDPWEVMHGMLAYGVNSRVRQGGANGSPITSVGWLCYNKPCKGQTMLYVNPEGELRAKYGVGVQGHLGQLLAMLAQCRVSADYPVRVGKNEFTIRDLVEAEKKTCYPKSELTFKLLALQYYIDLNDKWLNDQGLDWDFPRLLREEMAQPVRTAACGGTHRLSALSLTVKTRIRRGEPVDGEYAEAADFVRKYQQYAFRLQNRDGSLSTQWFKGPGDEDDDDRRIKTTGHILEWLCYSLSDEELRDQRTIRAVSYLANLMYSNYSHEWEVGPRSHALHALLLYDERVFQPFDQEGSIASYLPQSNVAKSSQSGSRRR